MTSRRPLRLICALFLLMVGCAELPAPQAARPIPVETARPAVVKNPVAVRAGPDDALIAQNGACWQQDESPAVIETVTVQGGDGPAARHRIVTPRQTLWFRAPCPDALRPDILAALQRALMVRGHYAGPVTARLDGPTRRALRAYQQARGLDSARLSLDAAQQLGLVAYTAAGG
jgi:hypothetical protein